MSFNFQAESSISTREDYIVIPAHLESKVALFAFLRDALSLPDYFGDNWDALEECLTDLSWLVPPKITLVHRDIPLEKYPLDQQIYLQILAQVAKKSVRLHVIFPEQYRADIACQIPTAN